MAVMGTLCWGAQACGTTLMFPARSQLILRKHLSVQLTVNSVYTGSAEGRQEHGTAQRYYDLSAAAS